jgi:nitrous oxide reductase
MAHEEQVAPVARSGISRRKLIATSATLAAAGVAVGAAGVGVATSAGHAALAAAPADGTGPGTGEPMMVHLKDANSGQFDVFVGERHASFTDRGMAAQVIQAASTAQ